MPLDYAKLLPSLAVFLAVTGATMTGFLILARRDRRVSVRVRSLADEAPAPPPSPFSRFVQSVLPVLGRPLRPGRPEELRELQARLLNAGLYHPRAVPLFLGARVLLIVVPVLLAGAAVLSGLVPWDWGTVAGAFASLLGLIGPGFWLEYLKAQRQAELRRALPDALDVIIICLEGGLSLTGALRRVTGEIRSAHPVLADELTVVEQEIYLGWTPSRALGQFGERCGMEEVRSLAILVAQSEELGTGIVKALNIYSETLREKRQQRLEERAQKAATKIVFPTLLFIFPALFVVLVGPAAIQLIKLFSLLK